MQNDDVVLVTVNLYDSCAQSRDRAENGGNFEFDSVIFLLYICVVTCEFPRAVSVFKNYLGMNAPNHVCS